ncbi:MAG: hypothetical protein GXO19_05940 [Epsilonproteobacteria bacterium]|nr:hypothetical protein [Campylobacterota bacterium]NPA57256.1 hypothetical protein [Campylobacterota bacterium]
MKIIPPNRFDTSGENAKRGSRAEALLRSILERRYEVISATPWEDIYEHWDLYLPLPNIRIDVKAMKKIERSDPEPQDRWHWIELHGVRPWDRGWLYGGRADYIAFETVRTFLLVPRRALQRLVEEVVERDILVSSPTEAFYRVYKRPNRPDRITLIETELLRSIAIADILKK